MAEQQSGFDEITLFPLYVLSPYCPPLNPHHDADNRAVPFLHSSPAVGFDCLCANVPQVQPGHRSLGEKWVEEYITGIPSALPLAAWYHSSAQRVCFKKQNKQSRKSPLLAAWYKDVCTDTGARTCTHVQMCIFSHSFSRCTFLESIYFYLSDDIYDRLTTFDQIKRLQWQLIANNIITISLCIDVTINN